MISLSACRPEIQVVEIHSACLLWMFCGLRLQKYGRMSRNENWVQGVDMNCMRSLGVRDFLTCSDFPGSFALADCAAMSLCNGQPGLQ